MGAATPMVPRGSACPCRLSVAAPETFARNEAGRRNSRYQGGVAICCICPSPRLDRVLLRHAILTRATFRREPWDTGYSQVGRRLPPISSREKDAQTRAIFHGLPCIRDPGPACLSGRRLRAGHGTSLSTQRRKNKRSNTREPIAHPSVRHPPTHPPIHACILPQLYRFISPGHRPSSSAVYPYQATSPRAGPAAGASAASFGRGEVAAAAWPSAQHAPS